LYLYFVPFIGFQIKYDDDDDLLLLPSKFIERAFELVDAFPQRVVGGSVLCGEVVVGLLNDVVVGLAKTPRIGHLGVRTLLVVATKVLPLLWCGAPAVCQSSQLLT